MAADLNDIAARYAHDQYTIRRKVFKLFGGAFHIFGPNDEVVLYSRQKAFKLKEDIRLFTGEDMQTEILSIRTQQVIDFGASYDVYDPIAQEAVGTLRRKGLKSLFKDEWIIFDTQGQQVGLIKEDSAGLAFLRRMHEIFSLIVPQVYHGELHGRKVCEFRQNRNPFVSKIVLDFSIDTDDVLDRRLGLAAAVLLVAIEGKQN